MCTITLEQTENFGSKNELVRVLDESGDDQSWEQFYYNGVATVTGQSE